MASREHLAKLREGPEAWNQWRMEHAHVVPDLRGADLGRAVLGRAVLLKADLRGANLVLANLRGADLRGADLGGANLGQADLTRAIFYEADFHETVLDQTVFGGTVLRKMKGLETCIHRGPSTIDHRTLAKSGPLPLVFLRGCGLSDWQIEAAKLNRENLSNHEVNDIVYSIANLRIGQAIQFYSCFISYSTKDQEFAERLHADLQNNGVRCWFAPHDMQSGKKIHEQIDRAIQVYDRLLLILSKHSMKSDWVKREILKAQKREVREKRRVLFPVRLVTVKALWAWECLDVDTGTDAARVIREYYIPDLSNWKDDDSYQQAFDRLLRDLKAETGHDAAKIGGQG